MATHHHHHHFLVVTIGAQGHINPARHLVRRLVGSGHARVTFALPASALRRMFPSSATDTEVYEDGGLISYTHYDDGVENGFNANTDLSKVWLCIKRSLSLVAVDLAARGRPITCVIYALPLSMAAEVAQDLGIPSVLFWIQPAAIFTIYHSYFHGYADLIDAHKNDPLFPVKLPGLPPMKIRDLPSFLTVHSSSEGIYACVLATFEEMYKTLDKLVAESNGSNKPIVLVNTFDLLEPCAVSAVDEMDLMTIGPMVGVGLEGGDLFELDARGYMEWLDSKAERSVVYVSFGSLSVLSRTQMDEISRGLEESGRPYLWVVRQDGGGDGDGGGGGAGWEGGEKGMVVEWCSQARVLSHRSVGCFVTHCGWNSMVESTACGVPMVMVPQWSDQLTNAKLAVEGWGTGVRGEVNAEGVLEGGELRRCVDLVMGEEEGGVEIRRRAELWRERAEEAIGEGGSSARNLRAFMERIEALSSSPGKGVEVCTTFANVVSGC